MSVMFRNSAAFKELDRFWSQPNMQETFCNYVYEIPENFKIKEDLLSELDTTHYECSINVDTSKCSNVISYLFEKAAQCEAPEDLLKLKDVIRGAGLLYIKNQNDETLCHVAIRKSLPWLLAAVVQLDKNIVFIENCDGKTSLELAQGDCRIILQDFGLIPVVDSFPLGEEKV